MVFESPFLKQGRGAVPATPLLKAAWKELIERPVLATLKAGALGLGEQLDFSREGINIEQLSAFFNSAIAVAKKAEPIVEAGNKYSVSDDFKKLNGELLLFEIETSATFTALSEKDQARAREFFSFMCLNGELRNRNPLHPNHLDSAVLGNLMNFPKHLFGYPFAGYSTNGYEALSLLFFSYRSESKQSNPTVVYVKAKNEEAPSADLQACAERLSMKFRVVCQEDVEKDEALCRAAVLMANFENPDLAKLAEWASRMGVAVHVHVWDKQLRSIFAESSEPVHFTMPDGVRSMSIDSGLFRSAYQVYRDTELRDIHIDLPYFWQSAYASPNEGGSGSTTPLYIDFCFMLLGWSALHSIAKKTSPLEVEALTPLVLSPYADWQSPLPKGAEALDSVLDWAKTSMKLPREELLRNVFQFQRNFVGGKTRTVEALPSGGGTRSGNLAFESACARAKAKGISKMKLLTGNPHLLVERAQRRFLFDVVRIHKDGAICTESLRQEICDPSVGAVYAQTLSITDGITDPLQEVLDIIEAENKKRQASDKLLITLINDCCLALSVLIHNDGNNGASNLRVLDLTADRITPAIVMLDAHKHLGADKGISMAMGTPGTLSLLSGHVMVGSQPSNGDLVRCMADMLMVGVDGYYSIYEKLGAAVGDVTNALSSSGMTLIHAHNRVKGSTAFGVEDPSGVIQRKVKKKGHSPSPLFGIAPEDPSRCQSGFLLHLTQHALREMPGGKRAVDLFTTDVVQTYQKESKSYSSLAKLFRENALPAFLLSGGNEELWTFELLRRPGFARDTISLILRRLYSGILDNGVICSNHQSALKKVVQRAAALLVMLVLATLRLRRQKRISKL